MLALLLLASWLPLEIGNQWTYRVDSRAATNQYITVKVTGQRDVAGVPYFVLAEGTSERLLREDDRGRIWEHTESGERLWPTLARPLPLYTSVPLAAGDYVLTVGVEPSRSASVPVTILP